MGKLIVGAIKEATQEFNVSVRIVGRIWQTAKDQRAADQPYKITTNYHNCGRKRVQVQQEQVAALKMGDRSCIRDLASNLDISK